MRTRHMLGISSVPASTMTTLMNGDALAAMEQLDGAGGGSNVDLLADQAMRNGVEEAIDFDMIIEGDAGQAPFRKLVVRVGQRRQERPLDRLEQMPSADAEPAHDMSIDALDRGSDRQVGLIEREEGLPAQSPKDVGLGEAHTGLDLRFVAGPARSGRQDADAVMGGHHAVATIEFGIVERSPVDARLQIVGHHQARNTAEEAEHADVGFDP